MDVIFSIDRFIPPLFTSPTLPSTRNNPNGHAKPRPPPRALRLPPRHDAPLALGLALGRRHLPALGPRDVQSSPHRPAARRGHVHRAAHILHTEPIRRRPATPNRPYSHRGRDAPPAAKGRQE